jgi:RNA polymerase sigma factor FliA
MGAGEMRQLRDISDESDLWTRWQADRDPDARDALVRMYLPLVELLAGRLGRFVPPSSRGDLVGFGVLGLLDAIDKFKPELGYSFRTYGGQRIRGAIGDGIRRLNWLPRGAHKRPGRIIEKIVPVDFQTATTRSGVAIQDFLSDPSELPITSALDLEEEHAEVAGAVSHLPERERSVIVSYYFGKLSLAQIGAELGVTESRACQIHRAALDMLREALLRREAIA